MDFDKSIDAEAVHMLKGKKGDILRLPSVMYLDCHTNLAFKYVICTIMYVSKFIYNCLLHGSLPSQVFAYEIMPLV